MPLYRTDGIWGTGKGAPLTSAEVDGNFYDHETRIVYMEEHPTLPYNIAAFTIGTNSATLTLSNGATLTAALTLPMPRWRDEYEAAAVYEELDFFTVAGDGLYAVMVDHTAPSIFDPTLVITGHAVYKKLIGFSGGTLES